MSNSNSGKYFIKIDLTRKENTIKFRCENSYTKKSEDAQLKRKNGGIGLDNLKKRLNATYNDRYKLVIDKGTEIFKAELEIYVD
ncbi:MAG: GHKL domain-containing protein [Sphingobacteriaceae bacterium]|nr:GHKL domain-containing protein [Sphingobacteriaceae bacterium]